MDLPSALLAVALVALGYVSGSIPVGVVVARLMGRPDPRSVGSGRTGGTNAVRALGWGAGLLVGLLDIVKGAVPVLIARAAISAGPGLEASAVATIAPFIESATGIAAVTGAHRSVFLGFSGGRGVAAGIGAMLVLDWRVIAIAAPVFFGVIAITRYVSLGSLIGTAAAVGALALLVVAGGTNPAYLVYGVAGGLLIWLAHTDNIDRLLHGTERRFSLSRHEGA